MILCVSDELVNLRQELNDRGYRVVNEQDNIACDAIICDLKNRGLVNIVKMNNNIKNEGTLIIDCSSKNVDEIEYILNNKSYSRII